MDWADADIKFASALFLRLVDAVSTNPFCHSRIEPRMVGFFI